MFTTLFEWKRRHDNSKRVISEMLRRDAKIIGTSICLVLAVASLYVSMAAASQIAAKPLAAIAEESAIVVVGVVEAVERLSSSVNDGDRLVAVVRIVSYLRGPATEVAFQLPLHVGGLRGFDTELAAGDQAIFFLRSIESGMASLQTWGSIARIPAGYFHVD